MKKHIRRGAFLLAFLLILPLSVIHTSAQSARLTLQNGKSVSLAVKNGENYVSLYALTLALGGSGTFDGDTRTMTVNYKAYTASAQADAAYIVGNGIRIYGKSNYIASNVLYVPLSSAARALGCVPALSSDGYALRQSDAAQSAFVGEMRAKTEAETIAEKYGIDHDSLLWLARIIYCESRGQPFAGQLAVGTVVMNRVASKEFPNTIFSVIFDTKYGVQFTPAGNGSVWCTPDSTALDAARQVLSGYRTDRNILYFMNEAKATSKWIRQSRPYAFKIGDHSFFY